MSIAPLILFLIFLVAAPLVAPLIPLRRRRQTGLAGFPIVTISLIALNIFLFAINATTQGDADGNSTIALSPLVAYHWGLTPHSANVVTIFTHLFLHADWGHLLGNMLGLYLFGPHVEEALGRLEYLLFYLAAGVAAALLHLVIVATLMPHGANLPLVGASGAISGVLGLFAVRFWRARVRVLFFLQIPAIWALSAYVLLQLLDGLIVVANHGAAADNTAHWAHVGGFLFGLAISLPLRMREESRREYAVEDAERAVASGHLEQAAAHYRSVLETTPADPAARYALGRVLIGLQQAEAAYRHLHEALVLYLRAGDLPAVVRVYGDAVAGFSSFPIAPALLQRVASACEETHQYALAQHALAELCRDHPDAQEAEMGLLRLGKLHLQKLGQPENAIGIFSEFLRLYPQSDWASHAERLRNDAVSLS